MTSIHPATGPGPHLVSAAEAAGVVGVSERTVRRWIAAGKVSSFRVGEKLIKVDLNEITQRMVKPL